MHIFFLQIIHFLWRKLTIFYVKNLTAGLHRFASSQLTFSFSLPSLLLLLLIFAQTNGLPFLTSVLLSYVCNFTSLQTQQDQNNIWSPDLPPLRFSHPQPLQPVASQRQSASLIISSMLEHH